MVIDRSKYMDEKEVRQLRTATRSGDPFAVQRLLGHANLDMATRYVQDVSEQTDRVIENSRNYLLSKENVA